jgi:SAM-dependent methyltransferase
LPLPRLLHIHSGHSLVPGLLGGRGQVQELVEHDLTEAEHPEILPFSPASFDAVLSVMALHTVNDLPGMLIQIRHILKPEGVMLLMLPGATSLQELRTSFAAAETALTGGLHPRVAPFIDVRDGGSLLQRAGFALPVADSETLTVTYPHFFALAKELRACGESNPLLQRKKTFDTRTLFAATASHYTNEYGLSDGKIPATLELVTLTGWAS